MKLGKKSILDKKTVKTVEKWRETRLMFKFISIREYLTQIQTRDAILPSLFSKKKKKKKNSHRSRKKENVNECWVKYRYVNIFQQTNYIICINMRWMVCMWFPVQQKIRKYVVCIWTKNIGCVTNRKINKNGRK